jgi:hypothetical protein
LIALLVVSPLTTPETLPVGAIALLTQAHSALTAVSALRILRDKTIDSPIGSDEDE